MKRLLFFSMVFLGSWAPIAGANSPSFHEPPEPDQRQTPSLHELLESDQGQSLEALLAPVDGPGRSVGSVTKGHLMEGVAVPLDGDDIAILPTHRKRGRRYGATNLVALLTVAAADLSRQYPGTRLMLGDVSQREGGDILGHSSHNSGRDVDIAFFYTNKEGEALEAETLWRLNRKGKGKGGRRFDVPRNWALVKALITSTEAEVQYLLVYDPLRRRLLAHAEATKEDPTLVARATRILRQPTDSSPHKDHFHLRVYCSRRDRLDSCHNRSPYWPWTHRSDEAVSRYASRAAELSPWCSQEEHEELLLRLVKQRSRVSTPLLSAKLRGEMPTAQVLASIEEIGPLPEAAAPLLSCLSSLSEAQRAQGLMLAGRAGDPLAVGPLARIVMMGGPQAVNAASALARLKSREVVPLWIDILTDDDPELREVALRALQRLGNRLGPRKTLKGEVPKAALEEVARDWSRWWQTNQHLVREAWLVAGFAELGVEINPRDPGQAIPSLLPLLTEAPTPIADNAQRMLSELTGYWFVSPSLSPEERLKRWRDWWRRNKKRLSK